MIGALLVVVIALAPTISRLIPKPRDRFSLAVDEDLELLKRSKKLPGEWGQIRIYQIRSSGSLAQQLIGNWKPKLVSQQNGKYKLDIFITDAVDLETRSYSVVIEYSIVDTANNNTVSQFGRTLKLGYIL